MNIASKEAQPWFAPTEEILNFYLSLLAKTVSILLFWHQVSDHFSQNMSKTFYEKENVSNMDPVLCAFRLIDKINNTMFMW